MPPRVAKTTSMGRRHWTILALLLVGLTGCGQAAPEVPLYRAMVEKPPPPTTTTTTTPPQVMAESVSRGPQLWPVVDHNVQLSGPPYTVADVAPPKIGVYDSPTAPTPLITMGNKTEHGLQRVFLVAGQDGNRYKVVLPVRPNGADGWVNASDLHPREQQRYHQARRHPSPRHSAVRPPVTRRAVDKSAQFTGLSL